MATMNIFMPDPMHEWVEAQTGDGRFDEPADYVRDLISRDQERRAKVADMQKLVDEARASEISNHSVEDIWRRALERAGQLS